MGRRYITVDKDFFERSILRLPPGASLESIDFDYRNFGQKVTIWIEHPDMESNPTREMCAPTFTFHTAKEEKWDWSEAFK